MSRKKQTLDYGRAGIEIEIPAGASIIRPRYLPGLPDQAGAVHAALRNPLQAAPLAERVRSGSRITIVHSDITRATPNRLILPVLLQELKEAGARPANITLICGLGMHKTHSPAEMESLLGAEILTGYRCIQHSPRDPAGVLALGLSSFGHPIQLHRALFESDLNVVTGFIEPHFFAGFSGGPKGILPGLASEETVIANHGLEMIGHPQATWGVTQGNPIWEEMLEAALRVENIFLLNVALNAQKQITAVFAGDLQEAHRRGCEFVRGSAMVKAEALYDVVVTTNSGYPLDQNLYQCVKGMSAAAQIVRPGGAILMAAACQEGLPEGSAYETLLQAAGSLQGLEEMLARPGFRCADQWQVQVQAMVQEKADVYVFSQGLGAQKITQALFLPVNDPSQALCELSDRYGKRVCVLPEGPQVIAYV